ncbi:hypothetical protein BDR26DRAFT_855004 [Obelidium mucronatum]|nr:hypothetical protein BDR26DRAFT_855004 [Obelidium mucronatum]
MFLDRIGQLGLLSHQDDTNIIAPLPLIVRKKMIWEAVQCLTQRSVTLNYTHTLTSFTHVKWYMELLGHGFNLPIEDVVIVNECINVYKTWLLEGGDPLMVPPGSKGYEQIFWQKIFMHASLLFQPRKSYDSSPISNSQQPATQEILTSEALVNTHVTLCRHILLMILTSAQQQTTSCAAQTTSNSNPASTQQQTYHLDFSRDTWIVLLKVLLGCADRLLTEPTLVLKSRRGSYIESSVNSASLNTGTPVSEKPILSRWGRSGAAGNADRASVGDVNPGPTMGDALCDFLSKVLIEVWLRSEEMDVGLWTCLKDQYEKWTHRVEIVRNWSAVTLALSNRTRREQNTLTVSFPSSPTFNLDLSEKFTVYAWHKFTYIIGNINAIEAPENFYVAVKGISRVVDSFLLVGTRREFHPEVTAPDGNTLLHMFGPWLFEAVTRKSPDVFLPSVDKTGFPVGIVTMEELRKGCLKIIGGILGVLNVFENVGIKSLVVLERSDFGDKIRACYPSYDQYASIRPSNNRDNDSDHPMSSSQNTVALKNLKPYLLDLLLNTLHVEQSATNTKHVLHLLSCFSIEEIDFCPASVSLVLGTVKEKILSKVWPQDVQSCAFDVLTQLTFFWEAIDKASKGSCKDVVVSLCNYIDGLFAEDNVVDTTVLLRWVLIGNWVEQEKELSVLARDDEFSVVGGSNNSNNHHHTTQTHNPTSSRPGSNYGSNGNLLATAGLASGASSITSGTEKTTLANHFAAFAGNPNNNNKPDVGVSTFAKLTADSAVKSAAEIALNQLLLHLGNFPARTCQFRRHQNQHLVPRTERTGPDSDDPRTWWHKWWKLDEWSSPRGHKRLPIPSIHPVVDSELDFTLQPPRDPKLILIFSWVLRYKYVEDSKRVEAYQEMQRQQFGGAGFGDSRSSSKADQEGKGSTGEGGENNNGAVGESLSPPPPERPLRPKSAPLLGGHVRKPPSPVKLKEQQLLPHETEGNIAEAFQAERKSQTQLEALNNGASARTSAAYMESNNNFPSNTDNGGEYHVRPKLPPYIPPNSDVLRGECFNESAIPKFSELLNPDTEEGRRFELLKKKLDRCIEIEKATYNSADDDRLCVDTAIRPTPPIDRFDVNVPCAVFRQFLSHMGYINLDTREKLKPMVIVLYAKNCTTTIEEMIHPKSTTPDFYEFLHSIGSPFCKTTSYFATRNVEMLFITPYTMKAPENEALKTVYMNSISENIVTILWIENLVDIDNVVKRVTSNITLNASTVIVIHPKSLAAS